MIIDKIINFAEDEFNALISAGKLIKAVRDELRTADESTTVKLSDQGINMLSALKNVIEEVLGK